MRKIDLTNFKVATSETARQINRRITLNFLRRQQPMSRADLARRSGLQRSTVSSIIDQLIGEGWVTEGATGRGRAVRGRRPRFLHLNVERASIVGVELRPETTTVALAGIDARVVMQTSWPTPRTPSAFIREVARTVGAFRKAHPQMLCEGLGVSLPGRLDASGRLVFAPNLGWGKQIDLRLRQPLEAAVGVPVMLENAANACALAELWFGGHPEHVRNLIAVTVSEGIGVGLLLNGQLLHGADGLAGEFGHVSIDDNGPACSCGRRGCWERFASNAAAIQDYVGAAAGSRHKGTPPHFDDILRLAQAGDRLAADALDRMAHYLGRGIAALVTGLAPDLIVVIGEVTAAWDRVGPIVQDAVQKRGLSQKPPRIIPTDPATQPRLRGAVTLVVQQHFGAPAVA